ncbi:MAG TPA: hypothetical protein VGE39_02515 [Prosthecobacter sp.]
MSASAHAKTPLALGGAKHRAYQKQAFWAVKRLRRYLLAWLRQGGKTTTLADQSLLEMAEFAGRLITFVSASLNIGSEFVEKEAKTWHALLGELRKQAQQKEKELTFGYRPNANSDHDDNFKQLPFDTDWEALADVMEQSKLELRIWHSNTVCSRTKIIAANIATARSWSGSVKFDEVAFIRELRIFLAEIEPIFSTDPTFNLIMATTPPPDFAHYAYELLTPEDGREDFPVKAEGHWFKNRAGMWVHRATIDDAEAAGRQCYHPDTGEVQTPDENRETSLDKEGWDRSNRLKRPSVGTSAMSPLALDTCQKAGRDRCFAGEWTEPGADLNQGTLSNVAMETEVSLGLDLASTEGKKSNPTALAVATETGLTLHVPWCMWWKTSDPALTTNRVLAVIGGLLSIPGVRIRSLNIDASNDRLFARALADKIRAMGITVNLIVANETTVYLGETVTFKYLQGHRLANAVEHGRAILPFNRYMYDDFMRVSKVASSFDCAVGKNGEHGDTFDAVKQAQHGFHSGGPAEAFGVPLSGGKAPSAWGRTAEDEDNEITGVALAC